jgi:TRAP-type C4-dicarboxylate transport system substrate-binding protein
MACENPIGTEKADLAVLAIEDIHKVSQGRIKIDFYPAAQLGSWEEAYGHLIRGTIDVASTNLTAPTWDPRLQALTMPCLYSDFEAAREAWSTGGFVYELAQDLDRQIGLMNLGPIIGGWDTLVFAKPINFDPGDPDSDKKGTLIRYMGGSEVHRLYLERYGFAVTTVPWADLYMALQTGVVDGYVGGAAEDAWNTFRDVAKSIYLNRYRVFGSAFLMNLDLWESLPPDIQDLVFSSFQKQSKAAFDRQLAKELEVVGAMKSAGWQVKETTKAEWDVLAGIAYAEVWPKLAPTIGRATTERLLAQIQQ